MMVVATRNPNARAAPYRNGSLLVEKTLSVMLLIWLLAGTFAQDLVFRSLMATLPAFAILAIITGMQFLRHGLVLQKDGAGAALLIFLGSGALALLLSFLGYPVVADLPRSQNYVLRQAYFLAVLPMAIVTGIVFWQRLYPWLYEFAARNFVILSIMIMTADLATAYLFGDPFFREINDYSKYADKLTLYFFFAFIFMARVTHPSRYSAIPPLLLLSVYFVGTKILTYGSLFAASTGSLLMVLLLIALALRNRPTLFFQVFAISLASIVLLMAVGTMSPVLFESDPNAQWRFQNWNMNFQTLHETGYLGVGFGTSYFPITSQDLEYSVKILKRGSEPWTGNTDIYDLIFLRAQHNSFVNLFFRMGLVGGLSFVAFNLLLLAKIVRIVRRVDPHLAPHLLTAFVLMITGITQTMLHVGIETPRFLIVYGLTVALVLLLTRGYATAR